MASNCKLCVLLNLSGEGIKKENPVKINGKDKELVAHVQIHRQHLRLIKGSALSTEELLEKCYGIAILVNPNNARRTKNGNNASKIKLKKRSSNDTFLIKRCREILAKRPKHSFVDCAKCGWKLMHKRTDNIRAREAIRHACIHVGLLFACRYCDSRFSNKGSIWNHLNKTHNLSGASVNFIDSSNDHQQETLDMLEACFGQSGKTTDKLAEKKMPLTPFPQMKNPMSNFCRSLFLNCDRKAAISCAECGIALRIFNNRDGKLEISLAVNHACFHLGKIIFICRHCNHGTSTKSAIQQHLFRVHKTSVCKENFKDLSSAHHDAIKSIMQKCFGQANNQPSDDCGTRDAENKRFTHSKYPILTRRCRRIFEKAHRGKVVQCAECNRKLIMKDKTGGFISYKAIHHACIHLGKLLVSCGHCESRFTTRAAVLQHLKKIHSLAGLPENYVDSTNDHQQEILDMFKRCFAIDHSADKKTPLPGFPQMKDPLSNFYRGLVTNCDRKASITCAECGKSLRPYNRRGSARSHTAISHACAHLNEIMFTCRHCDYAGVSKGMIQQHLINIHQLKLSSQKGNFNDLTADYHEPIKAMLRKCFGQASNNQSVDCDPEDMSKE